MNDSRSKISVVLPTFNGSAYLRQSIDSCLEQTYQNVELIIVDDGSTDDTQDIIRSYRDERFKCVRHEDNRGLPRALNSGFAVATGYYFTWTSDDNIYAPDAFEKMVRFLKQSGSSFVYCNFYRFRNDELEGATLDRLPDRADLKKGNRIGPCFLYTREVSAVTGVYDPDSFLAEDYDYWVRVAKNFELSHLPIPLYYFREHSGSLYQSRYFEVKLADYLVRLKNYIIDNEEVETCVIDLLLEKKRDFFGINRKRFLSMYSAAIRGHIEALKAGEMSNEDFRILMNEILYEVDEIGIDTTDTNEFLFVGVLDENLPNELLLSSIDEFRNLIVIETKSVSDELKEKLRAKGVTIYSKNPLASLYCNLLFSRGKSAVAVQPYRKVKWFISLIPFRRRFWLMKGELVKCSLWTLLGNEISILSKNLKRLVGLKIKRRKLMKMRQFPYEIGLPNDYSLLEEAVKRKRGEPKMPVSIIIPVYNRREELDRTLAGLTIQGYPLDLIEVVVADDGSSVSYQDIIGRYAGELNIKYVKQADRGYRLSAVRNLGIRNASHEVIVLLDCDMIPAPEFLREHMKWFHTYDGNLVVIGGREFIDPVNLQASEICSDFYRSMSRRRAIAPLSIRDENEPFEDWRIPFYRKTRFLKNSMEPYNFASGGNVSFRREFAIGAGLFDEEFTTWGGEDTEFFYRMHQRGAYIIPEKTAMAFHQNHPDSSDREGGRIDALALLERKIPRRRKTAMHNNSVPRVSIYMPSYNARQFIGAAIKSVIEQSYSDWELCICDDGSTDGTYEFVKREYGTHERVRLERIHHTGIGGASNHAVGMCRGEYVGQLDSDDELKPEAVEVMVDYLDREPDFGLVYSDYEYIDEEGNFISEGFSWPEYDPIILLESMIVHPFRMFRRVYWYRTPGFHRGIKNAVDYDMYLKLSEVTYFHHVRKILYRYRLHGKNTSILDSQVQTENHLKVVREALERRNISWRYRVDPENRRKIYMG